MLLLNLKNLKSCYVGPKVTPSSRLAAERAAETTQASCAEAGVCFMLPLSAVKTRFYLIPHFKNICEPFTECLVPGPVSRSYLLLL